MGIDMRSTEDVGMFRTFGSGTFWLSLKEANVNSSGDPRSENAGMSSEM